MLRELDAVLGRRGACLAVRGQNLIGLSAHERYQLVLVRLPHRQRVGVAGGIGRTIPIKVLAAIAPTAAVILADLRAQNLLPIRALFIVFVSAQR